MKKRILSMLLLVTLLVTGIPAIAVSAADEAAETPVATQDPWDLYVGATSNPTAEGGPKLLGLYTAFAGETDAYDLSAGKWFNKVEGGADATLTDTCDTLAWGAAAAGNGGLSAGIYDNAAYNAAKNKMAIELDGAMLASANFTVETSAVAYGFEGVTAFAYDDGPNVFGTAKQGINSFRIDLLHGEYERGLAASGNIRMNILWRPDKCAQSYCVHGSNGRSYGFAAAAGIGSGNGTSITGYAPAGVTMGVTKAYDAEAETYTYDMYYNNTTAGSKVCKDGGNNVYAKADYDAAVEALPKRFMMFNSTPMDVYAIRVYDGLLTVAEKNFNHLIDLLAFYQVAIPAGYTVADLAAYADAFAGTVFVYDNDGSGYDYDAVKASLEAAMAYDKNPTDYDAWYVEDRLVGLYTAFGDNISYNMSTKTWVNKAPNAAAGTDIVMRSDDAAFSWGVGKLGMGGIALSGVTLAAANRKAAATATGLDLPLDWAAKENLTVESTQIVYGNYGANTSVSGDETLNMRLDLVHVHFIDNLTATEKLCGGAAWHAKTTNPWYSGGRDKTWRALHDWNDNVAVGTTLWFNKATTHTGEGEEATYSVKYTRGHNYNASSFAKDALEVITGDTYTKVEYEQAVADGKRGFYMFAGIPADVYAIRVYEKNLTTAEKQLNHLIDLLAFYDVAIPAAATANDLASIAPNFYDTTFVTDNNDKFDDYDTVRAELLAVFEMLERLYQPAVSTELDDLYVQDGLVALYTAFGEDASVFIPFGTWKNKVEGGADAVLYDTSSPASFEVGANGGISITGITYDNFSTQAKKIGIKLSDEYLTDSFTVEQASVIYPLTKEGADGNLAGDYESFRFGALTADFFPNPLAKDQGAAYMLDWQCSQVSTGKAWYAGAREDTMRDAYNANGKVVQGYTMSVLFDTEKDGSVVFNLCYNSLKADYMQGGSINDATLSAEDYATELTATPKVGWFTLFNGVPADIYAIRVYDRTLSMKEMYQNHLVDLLGYYQVDVSNVSDASLLSDLALIYHDDAMATESSAYRRAKKELQAAVNTVLTVTVEGETTSKCVIAGSYQSLNASVDGKVVIGWIDENGNMVGNGKTIAVTESVSYTALLMDEIKTSTTHGIRVFEYEESYMAGIRFTADIDVASLMAAMEMGNFDVSVGMLITPKAYVDGAGAFTMPALEKFVTDHGVSADRAYIRVEPNDFYNEETGTIAAGIANFSPATLAKNPSFAAVAYIGLDFDKDGEADSFVYGTYDEAACADVKTLLEEAMEVTEDPIYYAALEELYGSFQ